MTALTFTSAPSTGDGNPQQSGLNNVLINENILDGTTIGYVKIDPAFTYNWDVQGTTTLNWGGAYDFERVIDPIGQPAGTYLRIFVATGKGGDVIFDREGGDFTHEIAISGGTASEPRKDVGSFVVTMRNVAEAPTKLGITTFGGVNGGDTTPATPPAGYPSVEHSTGIIGQLVSEDEDGTSNALTHTYKFVNSSTSDGLTSSDGVFKIESFLNQFNQVRWRVVINNASLYDYDSLPDNAKYFQHTIRAIDDTNLTFDRQFRFVVTNNTADDVPKVQFAPSTVNISQQEGTSSTAGDWTTYTYDLVRDIATGGNSIVTWSINGTGIDTGDFEALAGTATFVGNALTTQLVVKVRKDSGFEADENFTITLGTTGNTNASIGTKNTATGTIENDDTQIAAPTITGARQQVDGESTGTIKPFENNLAVAYANNTDALTVEVSFALANGTFGTVNGVNPSDSGTTRTYTFTGLTRDQLNTILSGMQFNPTDSFSTAANTVFTVQVKPAAANQWSDGGTVTVAADFNDNATGTIPTTNVAATANTAMNPFTGITVTDEENDAVTLTISFVAGGTWVVPASTTGPNAVNVTDNGATTGTRILTFTGKAVDVASLIDTVQYTPAAAGTKAFTVSVVDAFSGAGQHGTVAVGSGSFNVVAAAQNVDPSITGDAATVSVESTGTTFAQPFANNRLVIVNPEATESLTVQVSFAAANGQFEGQTAGGDATTKTYTFTGNVSQVNAWLAGLQFNPTDNFTNAAADTTFTVQVKPTAATGFVASNSNIKVTADFNSNATIPTMEVDQAATVGAPIKLLDGIELEDAENDAVTLTVSFATGRGTWGFPASTLVTVDNQSATGTIKFTGKAADVQSFLDNVTFTPTSAAATTISVSVVDAFSGAGQHTGTTPKSFIVTAGTAPTITGAAAIVTGESTGNTFPTPFNGKLAVNYANNTDQLTVQVSFAAGNGAFQGQTAGGDAATKTYTFTGTRDAVNTWLAGLQFNPTDNFGTATNTLFTVDVKPAAANQWSDSNSNITVAADFNDNATGTIPTTNVAATANTAMNPFTGITVTDEENDAVTLTISFVAGGTWVVPASTTGPNAVNVTDNGATTGTRILTFTGKAVDVASLIDTVQYTPAAAGTKAFTVSV
uniref:Calx-beta domain-containing protein n=4 Tax=Microvirga TaxID=186650 RepID=UPI0021C788FE